MNGFWKFVHNAVAHPLMAFGETKWSVRFHDWTAALAFEGEA